MAFWAADFAAERSLAVDGIAAGVESSRQEAALHVWSQASVAVESGMCGGPECFFRRKTMPAVWAGDLGLNRRFFQGDLAASLS